MSLVVEAIMLYKIKGVRSDLGKLSSSTEFLIILNLNELSCCGGELEKRMLFCYVRSRKVIEKKEA